MIPEGAIISGFISKIVNDLVDVTKDKARKADRDRKLENQSFETRIYQVIIDAINEFTYDKYKNQDVLYDTAENILKGFKDEEDSIVSVKSGLNSFIPNVDDTECERFVRVLCHEISKENNFDVYKEILLILLNKKDDCNDDELQKIRKKLDEVILKLDNQTAYNEKKDAVESLKFRNNKKQKYVENWNSRLFLHIDNDENPLTLADAFIMPDFKIHKSIKRMKMSDYDKLDVIIDKFIKYDRTSTMLITGVPGIGKSSIISWIANEYKYNDSVIILRFRDWEAEELKKGMTKVVCNTLKCRYSDLNDKILIIDGFDEMKALDIREQVLNRFVGEILDWENIKIIFTSRPTYINVEYFQNVIELSKFNSDKIERFFKKITGNELAEKCKIESNLEVLGIPVILYMAVMSNVDISNNPTKPELYSRIFAEKGGIFDKFCTNGISYSYGNQILRDPENIKKYLDFLRTIAFEMFETDNLTLNKEGCKIPEMEFEGKQVSVLDFPIKHFFEHTEVNIEFVHKSIYEYFVSEYIVNSINRIINEINYDKKILAAAFGKMFKCNRLSDEILEFLKFRIRNDMLNEKFRSVNKVFQLMLRDGMTFHTGICLRNVIDHEINVFINMLDFLHLWEFSKFRLNNNICKYLKTNKSHIFNLKQINLKKVDLRGEDLRGEDLRGVDLELADLRETDMNRTDLRGANLKDADLRGAYISGIELQDAVISGAVFDKYQIGYIKNLNLNLINVYLEEAKKIVKYKDICLYSLE